MESAGKPRMRNIWKFTVPNPAAAVMQWRNNGSNFLTQIIETGE
jgi:hypothetical protein